MYPSVPGQRSLDLRFQRRTYRTLSPGNRGKWTVRVRQDIQVPCEPDEEDFIVLSISA